MTQQRLRILFVEDCREDVEIEEHELRRAGLVFDSVRVETGEALYLALEEFTPSLIISDYTLPQMDGLRALRIAHALRPEVPFLFVSGTIGEERAVEGLKKGAADYVHKDNLSGLVPAVQRALREARERQERRKAAEKAPEALPPDAFQRLSGALSSDLDDLLTVIAGYTQLAGSASRTTRSCAIWSRCCGRPIGRRS
jgi:DNA-binding NtrC family response regulator